MTAAAPTRALAAANAACAQATPEAVLAYAAQNFGPVTLALSFSMEDMLLLHLAAAHAPTIDAFTLDTGRMFEESYQLLQQARERYATTVRVMFPERAAVQDLVTQSGPFDFYNSIAARKACCGVRKVEPLQRALAGYGAWVTGLRAGQSVTRSDISVFEWDAGFGLVKVNPLAALSESNVWARVQAENALVHPLHRRGFPSIGCAPCTRAVDGYEPGRGDLVDIRAGRWWWENKESKECGLHVSTAPDAAPSIVETLLAKNQTTDSVPGPSAPDQGDA